jgi:DNA-binding HxlR family transcriptional regulator
LASAFLYRTCADQSGRTKPRCAGTNRTVSVIGDRWTLLILRDCFLRVRRFEDFQARLGLSRAILADRLEKLTKNFVLTKVAYQERPTRYEYRLTPKGIALHPVILSMVHWGDVHLSGKQGRPLLHRHEACQRIFDPVMACSECGEPLDPRGVQVLPGPGGATAHNLPHRMAAPARRLRAAQRAMPPRDG